MANIIIWDKHSKITGFSTLGSEHEESKTNVRKVKVQECVCTKTTSIANKKASDNGIYSWFPHRLNR